MPIELNHAMQMLAQIKATADSGLRAIEAHEAAKAKEQPVSGSLGARVMYEDGTPSREYEDQPVASTGLDPLILAAQEALDVLELLKLGRSRDGRVTKAASDLRQEMQAHLRRKHEQESRPQPQSEASSDSAPRADLPHVDDKNVADISPQPDAEMVERLQRQLEAVRFHAYVTDAGRIWEADKSLSYREQLKRSEEFVDRLIAKAAMRESNPGS